MIRRDLGRLGHIALQLAVVVNDAHAASAEHVARAHEQRESDVGRDLSRLIDSGRLPSCRICDGKLIAYSAEPVAILGKVDRLGLRAHDVDAGFLQRRRQLQRGLPTQRDHHASGCSMSTMSMTSSNVSGSKYSLSEVS